MPTPLEIAVLAARQAGEIQRRDLLHAPVIREQSRHDIKLQTDVECEELIRKLIFSAFPEHAILGEEEGGAISPDQPTWIVDPLDGTVNFAHGIPHFCCSIALQTAGETVLGVVYQPVTGELFTAEQGRGAFLNGQRIQVSEREIDRAMIAAGFSKFEETIRSGMEELHHLSRRVAKVRILGAAAMDLAYVAVGRLEGFIEFGLRTWDIAAGALLVREAGGHVALTDLGDNRWDVRADNGKVWE